MPETVTSQSIHSKGHHYHTVKTRQTLQEAQPNISREHCYKILQKNNSKLNSTTYKRDNTSRPTGINFRNARVVQHCNTNVIYHIKRLRKVI